MKRGYQDVGSWTLREATPLDRRKAAWLYAQFVVSKAVSLKKTLVGLTPIRRSDLKQRALTQIAPTVGGLIEFYRSDVRDQWTPTGTNVPNYFALSELWWPNIADALAGMRTAKSAMYTIANQHDTIFLSLQQTMPANACSPRHNKPRRAAFW